MSSDLTSKAKKAIKAKKAKLKKVLKEHVNVVNGCCRTQI